MYKINTLHQKKCTQKCCLFNTSLQTNFQQVPAEDFWASDLVVHNKSTCTETIFTSVKKTECIKTVSKQQSLSKLHKHRLHSTQSAHQRNNAING